MTYNAEAAVQAGNKNESGTTTLGPNDYIYNAPNRGMIPRIHQGMAGLSVYEEGDGRNNSQLALRHTTLEDEQIFRGSGTPFTGDIDQTLANIGLDWKPASSMIRWGGIFENVKRSRQVLYRPTDSMFMDIVPVKFDKKTGTRVEGYDVSFSEVVQVFKDFADKAGIELQTIGKVQQIMQEEGEDRLDLTLYATAAINGAEGFELPGNDSVTGKLILRYPYKYGEGIKVSQMAIRKICTNAMNMPVNVGSKIIQHNSAFTLDKVTQALEGAKDCWGRYQQEAEMLSETVLSKDVAILKIIEEFGDVTRPATDQPKKVQMMIDRWNSGNFKGGEMLSAYNTAWGLLNLVTEYYNHEYGKQLTSDKLVSRLIDTTSSVNAKQNKFMASISSFAHAERTRQYGASSVAQAVRSF
jgi:hypothetical protein